MKNLKYLLFIITGFLISCNNNEEVEYPQYYPIEYEFEPEYVVFNRQDLTKEEFQAMRELSLVIYSEEDFPDEDLMGLQQLKDSNIDFNRYTLLLNYEKLQGIVVAHRYLWSKDIKENQFNFNMTFFYDENREMENPDDVMYTYYRTAVLVNKIPKDSKVEFWYSVDSVLLTEGNEPS